MNNLMDIGYIIKNILFSRNGCIPRNALQIEKIVTETICELNYDFINTDLPTISDNHHEFSILIYCWYTRNNYTNNIYPNELNYNYVRLINLCYNFGFFDLGIIIGDYLYNRHDIFADSDYNQLIWQFVMNYAKCLRRLGKYENAINLYAKLADRIKSCPDLSSHAHLLLTMGKAAHNHQLRTGYSSCLIKFATKRYKRLLNKEDIESKKYIQIARSLAICLDSQAKIEFEARQHSYDRGWNSKLINKLKAIWNDAMVYANQVGNYDSIIRIQCHSSYAIFNLSSSFEEKQKALDNFEQAIDYLQKHSGDERAYAVRFGQYADMLSQLHPSMIDDIKHYIRESVIYAEKEKDWRTLATNQIRLSRIFFDNNYADAKYSRQQIEIALSTLKSNLNERLPEIEIEANLELARQLRISGDYKLSQEYLNKVHEILLELEDRLHIDLKRNFSSQRITINNSQEVGSYVPSCLLTASETRRAREALFLDFQLHSSLLNKVANDRLFIANRAAYQTTTELQLSFIKDILPGQMHRFKGIIREFKASIYNIKKDISLPEESITKLEEHLQKSASWVENELSNLLDPHPNLKAERVSVSKIIVKLCDRIPQAYQFDGLTIFIEKDERCKNEDFYISCCPEILEMAIENIIVNGARAAKMYSNNLRKEVRIRIGLESRDNNQRHFGIIEVEDTGGRIAMLQNGLNIAIKSKYQKSNEKPTFGLPYSVTFFKGFGGIFEVSGVESINTILKLLLPFSDRINHDYSL